MIEIREYVGATGRNRFARWFDGLDESAASRVKVAIDRMEQGNLSNVRRLPGGISEYRINFGPGYRLYFGMDGDTMIILLAGGPKRRQRKDIATARILWREYRNRTR